MTDMQYIAGAIIQAHLQNNKRNLGVSHALSELRDAALRSEAAMHAPESRKVGSDMHIRFNGRSFSVARLIALKFVCIGDTLRVTCNLFNPDAVYVVMTGEDGWDKFYECPVAKVIKEDGFEKFTMSPNYHSSPFQISYV